MTDWVRMPNIYWAILNDQIDDHAEFVERLGAGEPITVTGDKLDLFNGAIPSPEQVPFFTDRNNRRYTVTADNKVRPETQ